MTTQHRGGRRKPLNEDQQKALALVRLTTEQRAAVLEQIEVFVKDYKARMVADAQHQQEEAIKAAHQVGISQNQIANEGVGHSSIKYVNDVLRGAGLTSQDRHRHPLKVVPAGSSAIPDFFTRDGENRVRVHLKKFPTISPAPDYPEEITGALEFDGEAWNVVEDSTDLPGLPGWLHWEVERPRGNGPHVLDYLEIWEGKA